MKYIAISICTLVIVRICLTRFQIFFYEKDQTGHFENILTLKPSPFVVVNSEVNECTNFGQGFLVSEDSLLITTGHLAWSEEKNASRRIFLSASEEKKKNLVGER